MSNGLPLRLHAQFILTKRITRILKALGLREAAIEGRYAASRAKRNVAERLGYARWSQPALHAMDRKLDAIIDLDGGFFVEAGGHDGYTQSNTYYLERFRGWRGVLVEPMREMAAQARRNRPSSEVFECALVSTDHHAEDVEMEFGDLFSTVSQGRKGSWAHRGLVLGWRDSRTERVTARTLSSVLEQAGAPAIDLLSLDVEGYECQVLRGLDFSRHAPAWILVEMHDLERGRAEVGEVLGERYVEYELLSPLDVLYRRRGHG